MVDFKRILLLAVLLTSASLYSVSAFAECGGKIQCIGVGPTPEDALIAHHNKGPKTFTLAFGSQDVATTSVSQTVYVQAVATTATTSGEMAKLGPINISGTDAADFIIAGGTCSTTNGPVHNGAYCTIEVVFNPSTLGSKSATLHVPLDPPACPNCITERIVSLTGAAGISDPSTDAVVGGLALSQMKAAKRFSRAQISNVQTRFESLRRNKIRTGTNGFAGDRKFVPVSVRNDYTTGILPNHVIPQSDKQEHEQEQEQKVSAIANALLLAASSKSFNLSINNNLNDESGVSSSGIGVWLEGNVNFGTRGATIKNNSLTFSTDGISVGADKQFTENLTLGLGLGMANDRTTIGTDGSSSKSEATSFFVYGSYQVSDNLFTDMLIGHGSLNYDLERYIASINDFAFGQREGDQSFASLSVGYEHRDGALLLSPYARFDVALNKLDPYTETGAVANAITYDDETLRSKQFSLGLRAESAHETNFGWALPQLRVEWNHNAEGDRQNRMRYANQPSGGMYSSTIVGENNDSLSLGIGSDFVYQNGLKLGVHYRLTRASSADQDQTIGFWLSKNLDGKSFLPKFFSAETFNNPVQVEVGYLQSDNLNRASDAADVLSDQIYNVKISSKRFFPVSQHTRLLLSGFVNGDRLRKYQGLNKVSVGAKAEYQYRTSSAFDAFTFALFGNAAYDNYDSVLRSGGVYSLGISARQLMTDKIGIFAAIQNNVRNAENAVFDTSDNAIRLIVDYSIARSGSLYLGAQYRKGDLVASTPDATYYSSIALASTPDDAFTNQVLTATRYEGETNIWTLGYNWSLGQRDSVDFSLMNITSTPTVNTAHVGYTISHYSLAYIMRF